MAKNAITLESIMAGVKANGSEKTAAENTRAFSQEDQTYAEELALLDKVAQDMTQDEVLKVAASAKLSGEIMADVVLQKIAAVLPQLLAASLQKIAVGDSEVITGGTREIAQDTDAYSQTVAEDQVGKSDEPVGVRQHLYANRTTGAQASGGEPSSNQGEPLQGTHGSAIVKGAMGEEGGDAEAILQELLQKQQAGTLSPEEEQILQQLLAQSGGGMGEGGGMPVQASARPKQAASRQQVPMSATQAHQAKVAAVEAKIRQYLG